MSSERQLDNTNNPWWGEHLHRYEEILRLLPNTSSCILDIACGSGFGSDFLAKSGNTVIGGDISEDTILECNSKFQRSNLSFEKIDGTKLPYSNESFDIIVSFETIEHTTRFQEMLNEFKRVVKKEGLIILSTPNFIINSPSGVIVNPYHTQEWIYEEFADILNNTYSNVKLLGQAYTRYNGKKNFNYKLGKLIENIFYSKGIRKLPIVFQDKVMNIIIGEPMYPLSVNYSLVESLDKIKTCKTFFAICKP